MEIKQKLTCSCNFFVHFLAHSFVVTNMSCFIFIKKPLTGWFMTSFRVLIRGFRGGFRRISLFAVEFGARDYWFKALSDCCSGIHSRWLLPPQTEE